MGQNKDQIATWEDLRSTLGYRLPYGVDIKNEETSGKYLDKGVTYRDLYHCSKGYLPAYESEYNALSDTNKRKYITKNARITDVYDYTGYTQRINIDGLVVPLNSSIVPGITFLAESEFITETKEIKWGTFTATKNFNSPGIVWNNFALYVSSLGSCTINVRMMISNGYDRIAESVCSKALDAGAEKVQLNLPAPTRLDYLKAGETYTISLKIYLLTAPVIPVENSSSGSSPVDLELPGVIKPSLALQVIKLFGSNTSMSFQTAHYDDYLDGGYQSHKCVRYDQIKNNHTVTVPVRCKISESTSGRCWGNVLRIFYVYTTNGSTWNGMVTGGGKIYDGGFKGSIQKVYDVTLNPEVSSNIIADGIMFYCGTTVVDHTFKIAFEINGQLGSFTRVGNNDDVEYWVQGNRVGYYAEFLRDLTGVEFSIS